MFKKRNDSISLTFATLAGLAVLMFTQNAWAEGIDALTSKVEAIQVTFRTIAGLIVGIGAIWCGLKFVKGDQDAWSYTWKFLLGGVIVFASGEIVAWMQT